MSEWISVKDRLPEKSVDVLVIDKDGYCNTARLLAGDCKGVFVSSCVDYWNIPDITHWMPLPEPPESPA